MKSSSKPELERQPRFGRREREYVLKVAMKVLKNRDDAEDVTQEAMIRAFGRRDSFRGDAKFTTWLHRVAVTSSLMHLRRERAAERTRGEALEATTVMGAREPSPEEHTIAGAQVASADRHVAQMSPIFHDVLRMNAEGYTNEEIGREIGISTAAVKTRVHRGLIALRAALEPWREERTEPR